MKIIKNFFRKLKSETQGQALIMVALALAVLIGFGALTTDVGYLYVQRRSAQNIADAASLAGTWAIQDGETAVKGVVEKYAEDNGIDKDFIHPGDTGKYIVDNKFVEVVIEKEHQLFLANILNINSAKVGAKAKATRSSIWGSSYKDILPLGLVGWVDVFYKVDKAELKNGDDFYELFKGGEYNPHNGKGHLLYNEFKDRPGILKDTIRDYLIKKYPSGVILVDQDDDDFYATSINSIENKYPNETIEAKLINDLDIYQGALQALIDEDPDTIFDVVFGSSGIVGSYGYLDLDVPGAAELRNIIENGFKGDINEIQAETGFINNVTADGGPLDNYITTRGPEAYIIAVLPQAVTGGKWSASGPDVNGNLTQYLIIHVTNLELVSKPGKDPRLTGTINKIFNSFDDITLTDEDNWEDHLQSWLIK